jgi:hypothetical protein
MTGENIPQGVTREADGPLSINPARTVATTTALWGLQPDRPLTDRQDHDPFNVWYERNGGSVVQSNNGYNVSTDPNQSGSEAILETGQLGLYRPGNAASVGGGFYITNRPTGDGFIDIAYTMDGKDDGLAHRITADDFQGKFWNSALGQEITVSRNAGDMDHNTVTTKTDSNGDPVAKVYGYDPMDGTGPSTIDYEAGHGYVYGFLIGWYGPASTLAYIKALGEYNSEWSYRTYPMYLVDGVGDPLFEKPNRPLQARASNGTTAENVEVRVLGRQFQVWGSLNRDVRPIFETAQGQSLPMDGTGSGANDYYVVAAVRRRQNGETAATEVGVEDFEIASDAEPLAVHTRTVDPSFLSGIEWTTPEEFAVAQSPIQVDISSDTSTRVSLDEFTDSDGVVKPEGVAWKGDIIGAGSKKEAREGDLKAELNFPIVRDKPTVWLARTRSGTSDDVDVNIQFETVG